MQYLRLIIVLLLIVLICSEQPPAAEPQAAPVLDTTYPGTTWEIRTPESVGLNSAMLDRFIANVGGSGVIIKNGYLVKSWGSPARKIDWASAAKPAMSTLLFHAVASGRLTSVDDRIDPWWGGALAQKDKPMTFRQLANMTSGYARGEPPGAAWAYNDYAVQLYCDTLTRVYDGKTPAEMYDRLFAALQLQDGTLTGTRANCGINASPRDFARIGWLWLNKGRWNDVQVIPQTFFDTYQKPDVPGALPRTALAGSDYLGVGTVGGHSDMADYGPGIYGFNWWFNSTGRTHPDVRTWPDAPADAVLTLGHAGNSSAMLPGRRAVLVALKANWGQVEPGRRDSQMNRVLKALDEAVTEVGPR